MFCPGRLLHAGFPSEAYRLVREAAAAYPDHSAARRILGFQRYKDEWITPFEAEQARKHYVWHDKFGWLLKTYVKRYEDGERYYGGRWMPAAKEEEIRQVFQNAWTIRTENFLIETNHSLERGVEIAKKLEAYHDFFVQTFVGFFQTPEQLKNLFNEAASNRRRHEIRCPAVSRALLPHPRGIQPTPRAKSAADRDHQRYCTTTATALRIFLMTPTPSTTSTRPCTTRPRINCFTKPASATPA